LFVGNSLRVDAGKVRFKFLFVCRQLHDCDGRCDLPIQSLQQVSQLVAGGGRPQPCLPVSAR
jgi:hypothetical protein